MLLNLSPKAIAIASLPTLATAALSGFRTVGTSGCTAQMVFVPPHTNTVVFIDNYHENYGGPGYNLATGAHSTTSYLYPGTSISVFGTEFDLTTNSIRPVKPLSNTFCSAGAFFPNGTMLNMSGAEQARGITQGFDKLRTFNPGPCQGTCKTDWVELPTTLQVYRWYPTSITMTDGSILVVGGSNKGGLVLNEANINVPTYEIIHKDGRRPKAPVTLPILEFTAAENLDPGKSYNLYPMLYTLPNAEAKDYTFAVAGNRSVIWDFANDVLVKTLPDTPLQPRTFPSSATAVMLPLQYPDYNPTVLVCGGCSGDMPVPIGLDDCWRIDPNSANPTWVRDDTMPNGAQVMSDGINLPDGTILFINGARTGSAGGLQADDPVFTPMIYNPSAPAGSRFTNLPVTTIPRMYHSVATLLPSGEVLVAGSNPVVGYSRTGKVGSRWPRFNNNGHLAALEQQQRRESAYPSEYRVEIFTPPYLSTNLRRPIIMAAPEKISYNSDFTVMTELSGGARVRGKVQISLVAAGFHTHGMAMGQRVIMSGYKAVPNTKDFVVKSPRDASVMPPGIYLLFVVNDGVPSNGTWISLE
ncbi:hypothetical protein HYALB_00003251 [Hymenoscyphus albidus]|uniref:Glyoxal oxidase n=1 Tax=Hymenoscyphus albidus TaxID=595503 RepID=A0A9N9LVY8_9HELO|nr:hypothetical protein HYALB_00003251 [Hymenoscyphus albidus]